TSDASGTSKLWVCVCSGHNFGWPHQVPQSTYYHHLKKVTTAAEREKIQSFKALTLQDAMELLCLEQVQPGPSTSRNDRAQTLAASNHNNLDSEDSAEEVGHRLKQQRTDFSSPSGNRLPSCEPTPLPYDFHLPDRDLLLPRPPSPPPDPPQDRDRRSPTPRPRSRSPEQQENAAIIYNRRRPPKIDLDALAQATILPKLRESMEFVSLIRNASFLDLITKLTPDIIERMRNAPQGLMDLNNPGLHHSISCYLSNEHASQITYDGVIRSTLSNFPQAEGVEDCLSFKATESFIKKYTG
ncbi:hypothetical protein PAXRUDRAFT_115945, partial [Paxillus rubicundulus Ve08.2h10]